MAYNSATISVQAVLPLQRRTRLPRIDSTEAQNEIYVFPNPAMCMVNDAHPSAKSGDKIFVYNVNGLQVARIDPAVGANTTNMTLTHLAPGIYRVLYAGGQNRYLKELIVK